MSDITKEVQKAVQAKVAETVAKPNVIADPSAVAPITAAVVAEMAPRIEHLTGNESFVQSRVSIGASAASVGAVYLFIYTWVSTGQMPGPELGAPVAVILWGGLYSLWGRWVSKKPLGS